MTKDKRVGQHAASEARSERHQPRVPASLPVGEAQRLATLRAYGILDTPPEAAYDRIVRLGARATQSPITVISLIDENRLWFKARVGLEVCETD